MTKQFISIALVMFLMNSLHAQKTGMHITNVFPIPSPGGWDYLEVGPVNDWLYVSHGGQVNVLNKKTGDSVGVIPNTTGVHGIAFDIASGKGYTSNGRINTVTVFDMNTNAVLGQIPAGQNPDWIMFEPFSKKIVTCNGRGKNLSFIDPVMNKVTDSVDVGGKPETAVSDGAGKLFVNVEDKNEIVEIDIKTLKVLNHWSILPGESPTGLAFDKRTKRLFAGCEKLLMIIDATNGKVVDKITIGDGCDGVAFDDGTGNIFTSNGSDATISAIHEKDANHFELMENIATKKSARTIAVDKQSHMLYLPAADFEPADPAVKGRPKMKAGSFQILAVGK